jgi:hypothetical protein
MGVLPCGCAACVPCCACAHGGPCIQQQLHRWGPGCLCVCVCARARVEWGSRVMRIERANKRRRSVSDFSLWSMKLSLALSRSRSLARSLSLSKRHHLTISFCQTLSFSTLRTPPSYPRTPLFRLKDLSPSLHLAMRRILARTVRNFSDGGSRASPAHRLRITNGQGMGQQVTFCGVGGRVSGGTTPTSVSPRIMV